MTPAAAAALFSAMGDFPPALASLLAGFATVDWWGGLVLTKAGAEYLAERCGE